MLIGDEALVNEIERAIEEALPQSMLCRVIHDIVPDPDNDGVLLVETNLVSTRDEDDQILGTETIRYSKSDRKILDHESDSTE